MSVNTREQDLGRDMRAVDAKSPEAAGAEQSGIQGVEYGDQNGWNAAGNDAADGDGDGDGDGGDDGNGDGGDGGGDAGNGGGLTGLMMGNTEQLQFDGNGCDEGGRGRNVSGKEANGAQTFKDPGGNPFTGPGGNYDQSSNGEPGSGN